MTPRKFTSVIPRGPHQQKKNFGVHEMKIRVHGSGSQYTRLISIYFVFNKVMHSI